MSSKPRESIVDRLGRLSREEARVVLESCCGSKRWVEGMLERFPFPDEEELFASAGKIWRSLGEEDWLEAFSHHPRIGERAAEGQATGASRRWSEGEQAEASKAEEAVRHALAEGNHVYEERFGHVFLIRAAGRSGEEMLAELRRRLTNDPAAELREAAGQQAEITRLRLENLRSETAGLVGLEESA